MLYLLIFPCLWLDRVIQAWYYAKQRFRANQEALMREGKMLADQHFFANGLKKGVWKATKAQEQIMLNTEEDFS